MPRVCDRLALLYRGHLLAEDFANRWIAQTDDRLTIAGLDADQRAQVAQLVTSLRVFAWWMEVRRYQVLS